MIDRIRSAAAFCGRPGSERRLATVWGYLKICLIEVAAPARGRVRLFGYPVAFPSATSRRLLFEEIFLGAHYRLAPTTPSSPLIVDAGANIGIAALYFKLQRPGARILCFEPEPESASYLRTNVRDNRLSEVSVHELALGTSERRAVLHGEGLGASLTADFEPPSQGSPKTTEVDVIKLSRFLETDGPVDVLKLDIEGAEADVLDDLGITVREIDQVLMECHSAPRSPPLSRVLATLEQHGHRYEVTGWKTFSPEVATCIVRSRPRKSER
jgi:FkbM family methyltransferase